MRTLMVDSSYWITMSRQGYDPIAHLAGAAQGRDLAICGVIRCEVARGVVHEPALQRLRRFWDVMLNVPADNRIWEATEALLWRMDRAGRPIPLPGALIACCALRIQAAVLTYDRHFHSIPGLVVTADPMA